MPTRYSPVRHSCTDLPTVIFPSVHPFDLHVLGTPPAFILSQDQTLMFVRLPAAVPSAGFTVLFGSMGFSMDCLFFEFPLNFPFRFPLPSCSPFTGLQAFRFFGALGIFRAALLFICQGSVIHKMVCLVFSDATHLVYHAFFIVSSSFFFFYTFYEFVSTALSQWVFIITSHFLICQAYIYQIKKFYLNCLRFLDV